MTIKRAKGQHVPYITWDKRSPLRALTRPSEWWQRYLCDYYKRHEAEVFEVGERVAGAPMLSPLLDHQQRFALG